ncbi:MAG: HK97 family phage prohead protease [Gammaproteobacteria bacterium]|nr:HK97 family phage prohead protease [Gammaproteobacteria bacterium]
MRTDFDRKDLAEKYSKMEYLEFGFEVKQIDDGEEYYTIKGYASTFGNVDRGGDVVIKGAFRETLKNFMPSYLWIHKMDMPIGKVVDAFEDDKGLFIEARCPKDDTFVSGRVIPQMKIGSVATMSIGYYAEEYEYDDEGNRLLKKIVLFEVSPVHLPMNSRATIESVKSLDIDTAKEIKTKRDFEKALRDLGASQKAAVYLAGHFNSPEPSESETGTKELIASLSELKTVTQKFKEIQNG